MPSIPRSVLILAVASFATLPVRAQDDPKEKPEKPAFKRLDKLTDEDLRKQLLKVPEIGYDQAGAKLCYTPLATAMKSGGGKPGGGMEGNFPTDFGVRFYNQLAVNYKRPDWTALPWRTGDDAQLGKEAAERLQVFSREDECGFRRRGTRPEARQARQRRRRLQSQLEQG